MTMTMTAAWPAFIGLVVLLLLLDLKVVERHNVQPTPRQSLLRVIFWIGLAFIFNLGIYLWQGPEPAMEFLTGYLIEKSLSMDNIFVFALVFAYFKVPENLRHKVLFWGILGALVMRLVLILIGVQLIERFSWIIYLFGAFLIYTSLKMLRRGEATINPETNWLLRLLGRVLPVWPDYHGSRFFVYRDGRRHATLLLAVLVVIESTDLVFAVDSIPAIFAITTDPFLVYSSNIFAILGLRSLYFLLAHAMGRMIFLKYGLAAILLFVGIKMILSHYVHLPPALALGVILTILVITAFASHRYRKLRLERGEIGPAAPPEGP